MALPELEEEWEFKDSPSHCVINSKVDGGRFDCLHCGTTYLPALPCAIDMYLAMMQSFIKSHKDCELLTENRRGEAPTPEEIGRE
jgi:hypothetical protein